MRMNIPNQITLGRLLLTIVFFVLLTRYSAAKPETHGILATCFWIYLVAALTDLLDGYLARTWKQVTAFGRVMDPVVDKVMVCGAFVFFASSHFAANGRNIAGVEAWIPVLILVREFLVSAIRSFSESHGVDFAANWVGKLKSFVQFTTVCVILGVLAWFESSPFFWWLRVACIWSTVVVTAASIIAYVHRAQALVLSPEAMGAVPTPEPPAKPAAASTPTARRVEGASA
jgi:CDP-diacylglycerol--glycerol-3-phosphate 3-phosphatidyltransferase